MTNFEYIKSLSLEELADWLESISDEERDDWDSLGCYHCINYGTHHYNDEECGECEWFGGIENWLKQEREE